MQPYLTALPLLKITVIEYCHYNGVKNLPKLWLKVCAAWPYAMAIYVKAFGSVCQKENSYYNNFQALRLTLLRAGMLFYSYQTP